MQITELQDVELVYKIKSENSGDAFVELKKRTEKCYYKVCDKYCRTVPALKYQELVEDVNFVLQKSISSFDKSKNTKFSSWLTNHSRFHILNTIKYLNEVGHFIPTENNEIDEINNRAEKFHFDKITDSKDFVFKILDSYRDERAKTIFEMRFFGDNNERKWKNISDKLNLTSQQVNNIYHAAKKEIYKKIIKGDINK